MNKISNLRYTYNEKIPFRGGVAIKNIFTFLLFSLLVFASNEGNLSAYDASDSATNTSISVPMTTCVVSFGEYHGLYVKLYQPNEEQFSCSELSPLFSRVSIKEYALGKRVVGKSGSISFGKLPNQCNIELEKDGDELVGVPYGNEELCTQIRVEGTTQKVEVPHFLSIFKYGNPHSRGQTFPSKTKCEISKIKFSKENAMLDYTYKCVKVK